MASTAALQCLTVCLGYACNALFHSSPKSNNRFQDNEGKGKDIQLAMEKYSGKAGSIGNGSPSVSIIKEPDCPNGDKSSQTTEDPIVLPNTSSGTFREFITEGKNMNNALGTNVDSLYALIEPDIPSLISETIWSRLCDLGALHLYFKSVPKMDNILFDAALRIAAKANLGCWNFYGALYEPSEDRKTLQKIIKSSSSKIAGSKFYFPKERPDDVALQIWRNTLQGIPSITELTWVNWLPNGSHLFFALIAKVRERSDYSLIRHRCEKFGLDFICAFMVSAWQIHHMACILFNRKGPESRRRAHSLTKTLVDEDAASKGWSAYRAHPALMDQIMKLNKKIKNALNPNDILTWGKNGIWPANYEKVKWTLNYLTSESLMTGPFS
ncbi:hypothetical protein MGYG_05627 [Nannizzia gypsea CBS 118893]|uniref:Uncharacterized protein n=1 Tax=Arthroderma gypseum (strain ATCC MYA-4604 / CBS 118893) TaxID=535722 RepID=E4UWZ1_ARTGP|nr:hypothetical protein MGYG_05627 [Nannizzia gypsea CBS 118893]EFR02630.1 hypothetical protein MGYG_05627 [Nannizzia gypsea CBS 118893]